MPRRTISWQRLNRHPKHRWAMLKNMAASLFLHERIITTHAKAKALSIFVHKIFSLGRRNSSHSISKIYGFFDWQKRVIDKFYNELMPEYYPFPGSIVNITKLIKRRKGDNSLMSIVELPFNNKKLYEESKIMEQVNSNPSFPKWERFTRTNELLSIMNERKKWEQVYNSIKFTISEVKKNSKNTNIKRDIIIGLFGDEKLPSKLINDPLIPPSHYVQLYIKAVEGENCLDNYYNYNILRLDKLAYKAKFQLEKLNKIFDNKLKLKKYEIKNFYEYALDDTKENYLDQLRKNKKEDDEINEEFLIEKNNKFESLSYEKEKSRIENIKKLNYDKNVLNYIKDRKYDVFNLTQEQVNDVNQFQINLKDYNLRMEYINNKVKENENYAKKEIIKYDELRGKVNLVKREKDKSKKSKEKERKEKDLLSKLWTENEKNEFNLNFENSKKNI